MKLYALVLVFVWLDLTLAITARLDDSWTQWKQVYRKAYTSVDEDKHRLAWEANVKMIQAHNLLYDLGEKTFSMGLNQFSDMNWEEFKRTHLSSILEFPKHKSVQDRTGFKPAPNSLDWRTVGNVVTRVKDQGNCGSCWAFATTGSIEGQYNQIYQTNMEFSEQQLIDCSTSYENHGCHGGAMNKAYRYIHAEGIESEDDYPYRGKDRVCHHNATRSKATITQWLDVKWGDEVDLKQVVTNFGPVAVAIDAGPAFAHYKHGIYSSLECGERNLNHAVLVVGYGVEDDQKYWIVKNSWNSWWGDKGYIRMARDHANMCGIASEATVPVIKTI